MFTEKTTSNLGSALSQAANWPLALMTFATSCTKPPGDEFGPCAASNGLMSGFGSMPMAGDVPTIFEATRCEGPFRFPTRVRNEAEALTTY